MKWKEEMNYGELRRRKQNTNVRGSAEIIKKERQVTLEEARESERV